MWTYKASLSNFTLISPHPLPDRDPWKGTFAVREIRLHAKLVLTWGLLGCAEIKMIGFRQELKPHPVNEEGMRLFSGSGDFVVSGW
jgi:hypothetical protein